MLHRSLGLEFEGAISEQASWGRMRPFPSLRGLVWVTFRRRWEAFSPLLPGSQWLEQHGLCPRGQTQDLLWQPPHPHSQPQLRIKQQIKSQI